jgi:hypothetical protein
LKSYLYVQEIVLLQILNKNNLDLSKEKKQKPIYFGHISFISIAHLSIGILSFDQS